MNSMYKDISSQNLVASIRQLRFGHMQSLNFSIHHWNYSWQLVLWSDADKIKLFGHEHLQHIW